METLPISMNPRVGPSRLISANGPGVLAVVPFLSMSFSKAFGQGDA